MSAVMCLATSVLQEAGAVPVYRPGLAIGVASLILLMALVYPRLRSWYRGRHRPVLDPLQLEELIHGPGVLVVDLREAEAYRRGHILGSLHVPYGEFPRRFEVPDPSAKRALVLVDESDALSHQALDLLVARGYRWIYVLKGGMRAWRRSNRPVVKAK